MKHKKITSRADSVDTEEEKRSCLRLKQQKHIFQLDYLVSCDFE